MKAETIQNAQVSSITTHSRRVTVSYGFWLFIISDIILFASLFATYGVLREATNGGPTEVDLFDLTHVGLETTLLLLSSFTCGLSSIATTAGKVKLTQLFLLITIILGGAFVFLELQEFNEMINKGAVPQKSAFLSAFYLLVGCHGLHVSFGIIWAILIIIMFQRKGFTPTNCSRLFVFSLFWHALDIVWVGVFTIVYLIGVI